MPDIAQPGQPRSRLGGRMSPPAIVAIVAFLACAPLALAAGSWAAAAQDGKKTVKAKSAPKKAAATKAAPPLPNQRPGRLADALEPAKAEEDGGPQPPAVPAMAVQPASPDAPEAGYFAAMDKLIAPVRDGKLSPADVQRLKDALGAIDKHDPSEAYEHAAKISEPVVRTLVRWYALRGGVGAPADYARFLAESPGWPDALLLKRRSEQQLLSAGGPAKDIVAFFAANPPLSGAGSIALASAHLALGDEARAKAMAVKAWRENDIPAPSEAGFLARFERFLSVADHRRRLDAILIDEGRFSAQRTPRVAAARRLLAKLEGVERKKAEARIAIYSRARTAAKLVANLPAGAKELLPGDASSDWGLLFQRIQLARSQGKEEEVARLLRLAPADADALVDPDAWWLHRRWVIYEFLGAGRYKEAYDIARAPGPLTVNPIKDATFLAGWIALRHLKNGKAAVPHLEASRENADGPLSAARGNYWLARAHETLGQTSEANRFYKEAAARIDTFHGVLARQKLDPGPQDAAMPLPIMPSASDAESFNAHPMVRAAMLAHHADVGRGITRIVVAHLRSVLKSEAEMAMLAHLANAIGDHQMAVRVGKSGVARGMNLYTYSYPVHPFPEYKPLRQSPERALLLAIVRQESEFNSEIVSHAGARGLMQVMPITARHICRDHKIKCDIPRLVKDTSYNAMIGSAYIGDRKAEFDGSYVLTLAGYNAGPGRARQWMRRFGDPRTKDIDAIDWIEMIPFEETREYVKKVLSNVQMYRARLGEPTPMRLVSDLKR